MNNTEYIPYGRQEISEGDIESVVRVLRSPMITQGEEVPKFENELAKKTNSTFAVAVNSATSALHIACLAVGLKEGDWLWTSPISFVASANCGVYCGANIDFVDISLEDGLINIESLEKKIEKAEKEGKLPKVLVVIHLAGTSCEMKRIAKIANKYNIIVIEDASHAIGGSYHESKIGSCKYSDITVFSFHPVKIITTGEGGVATTNSLELAERMRLLRSHGITKEKSRFVNKQKNLWSYEQQLLGFNYRMTDIQAALGRSQLQRLDDIVATRNKLRQNYEDLIKKKEIPCNLLTISENVYSAVHLAVIVMSREVSQLRTKIFEALRNENIGVQVHYTPIHLQPYYQNMGFKKGDFVNAERYAESAITLPLFTGLKKHEQERVIETIKRSI